MIKTIKRMSQILALVLLLPMAFIFAGSAVTKFIMLFASIQPKDANLFFQGVASLFEFGISFLLCSIILNLARKLRKETKSSEAFLSTALLMAVFGLGVGMIAIR